MSELKKLRAENEYIIRWNYIDYIVGIRDLSIQPGTRLVNAVEKIADQSNKE